MNALPRISLHVCLRMCAADVWSWIAYFSEGGELGHLGPFFLLSNGPSIASTFPSPTTPREQEIPLCLWESADFGPYSKDDISG